MVITQYKGGILQGLKAIFVSVPGPLHPNHPNVSMSFFRSWGTGCSDVRQPKNISEVFFLPRIPFTLNPKADFNYKSDKYDMVGLFLFL